MGLVLHLTRSVEYQKHHKTNNKKMTRIETYKGEKQKKPLMSLIKWNSTKLYVLSKQTQYNKFIWENLSFIIRCNKQGRLETLWNIES